MSARAGHVRLPSGRGRGQTLVEFALILPIILMILLGAVDLGRAAFVETAVSNAARVGARVAIVDQNVADTCGASPTIARCAAARQAVTLGLGPAAVAVTFLEEDLSDPCAPVAVGCLAAVTVTYTFSPITPIIHAITGDLPISVTTHLPVERAYVSP